MRSMPVHVRDEKNSFEPGEILTLSPNHLCFQSLMLLIDPISRDQSDWDTHATSLNYYQEIHSFEHYILKFAMQNCLCVPIQNKGERRHRWQRCRINGRMMGFDTSRWVGECKCTCRDFQSERLFWWMTHSQFQLRQNLNACIGKHVRIPAYPWGCWTRHTLSHIKWLKGWNKLYNLFFCFNLLNQRIVWSGRIYICIHVANTLILGSHRGKLCGKLRVIVPKETFCTTAVNSLSTHSTDGWLLGWLLECIRNFSALPGIPGKEDHKVE